MVPHLVALALQADGWYLRSHVIWAKGLSFCEHYSGSVMPESVRDRPTSAHEAVFLLTKSERYFYNADAVQEAAQSASPGRGGARNYRAGEGAKRVRAGQPDENSRDGRNLRNVWAISPRPYSGSHYAVFPPQLVAPMVKAGCPAKVCAECGAPWDGDVRSEDCYSGHGDEAVGGIVLDPFLGSGTVGQVAQDHGRQWIGFDLDERNLELIHKRTAQMGLFG